jgi:hypothetical protein
MLRKKLNFFKLLNHIYLYLQKNGNYYQYFCPYAPIFCGVQQNVEWILNTIFF